jgi:uncharacterized membrane protein
MRSTAISAATWIRIGYACLAGLVGAGIVHIVILLLVPEFSERDAWARLESISRPYEMTVLDAGHAEVQSIGTTDPSFVTAACRFDLSEGSVHVGATGNVPLWSAAVYDRGGANLYSLTDRSAVDRVLDLVILTPDQMIEARKDMPEDFDRSVLIETPAGEGIVVVRAFVPDASWAAAIGDFVRRTTCTLR